MTEHDVISVSELSRLTGVSREIIAEYVEMLLPLAASMVEGDSLPL